MGQPDVYETVTDPSVTVRFPLTDLPTGANPLLAGADLLVWTTTPWTLVSNTAVAVHPDETYAVARKAGDSETVVVAEKLLAHVLGEGWHVLGTVTGAELAGAHYRPPFSLVDIPGAHVVVTGTFVTTEDGTGLVHIAPAFGADDMEASRAHGLPVVNPVGPDGRFDASVPMVGGMFFKDADQPLTHDLAERGLLFRSELADHSYPHCWRCHTPLLYYALPSWYIRTTAIKDQLLAQNEMTNWQPPSIKYGRYGEWLRNNVDWALSRTRYWGTPLPIWECQQGHATCVGSLAELSELAGTDLTELDPHRPFVDEVAIACRDCGGVARRVPEVIDAWYDSGSMPFARHGAPRRNEEEFERTYPGAVHLRGDRPDPGLVLLADGGGHAGLRPLLVRERRLPRPGGGRARAQDEQAPGQRAGTDAADGGRRGGRGALVLRRRRVAVVDPQDRARGARRDRAQGAAHLLEHRLVPGAVRQRGRHQRAGVDACHGGRCARARPPGHCSTAGCSASCTR